MELAHAAVHDYIIIITQWTYAPQLTAFQAQTVHFFDLDDSLFHLISIIIDIKTSAMYNGKCLGRLQSSSYASRSQIFHILAGLIP